MKTAPLSRRDRLRQMLADLHMPGALESLDAILHGVDGATLTAAEAIEQLLGAQIQLRNNRRLQAAMRSSRLPVIKRLTEFDFSFQPSRVRRRRRTVPALQPTSTGWPSPSSTPLQRRSSRHASRRTHAPSAAIRPLASASGMKSNGGTTPRSGWCQRTSASTPRISPVARSIWGW